MLKWFAILIFFCITFFPFVWMIVLSFRPISEVLQNPAGLPSLDQILSAEPYIGVWVRQDLGRFIGNSLIVSLSTVAVTVVLSIIGAYAITRLEFRGRNIFNVGIFLIYMFPAMILAVPLFVVFTRLGLRNSLFGLVIVYLAQTLPVALYMLRRLFPDPTSRVRRCCLDRWLQSFTGYLANHHSVISSSDRFCLFIRFHDRLE